jgi:hypothetical protein
MILYPANYNFLIVSPAVGNMDLGKILRWVLNNPVLLAPQDFIARRVLNKMPPTRYASIRYKKSILFKIFCFGAGTLTRRHLEKNDIELSLRYACEIVSNQGYVFYSQNWKVYLLYVGLMHAYRGDYEKASSWLSEGIKKQKNSLLNAVSVQSYPDEVSQWLAFNMEAISNTDGWQKLFNEAKGKEEESELLLIYISIFVFALGLTELVEVFFDVSEINHHSDWKKMIVYRQKSLLRSRHSEGLTNQEIWHGTYPDVGQKLAANILHKTFSSNAIACVRNDDAFQTLAKMPEYPHISHEMFALIMKSCNLVNQSKCSEAIALLEIVIERNSKVLNSISSRPGPTKLFLAGFGWSGSSAVHDACRGYQHTKDMPGAGDLPGLNVGADSEPMLHQGEGGLSQIVHDLTSANRISETTLKSFFKNYVLLMPAFTYLEYKTVNANRSIIERIGLDRYYLLICEFIYKYASALNVTDTALAIDSIESFQASIINAMFADDDIVFFNNSIFAHRAKVMDNIRGRSYYIAVNRRMSDQFCDQMRSNKFFNATFLEFYLVKLSRVIAYKMAKMSSKNEGVEFIDIMFESWVQDAYLREAVTRKICGNFDKGIESEFFHPEISRRNINIPREHLGSFDRMCLGLFERAGMSI